MKTTRVLFASIALVVLGLGSIAKADLVNGVISDFQDGTVQGWAGGTVSNNPNSGPDGPGDFSLNLTNGAGGNFAMFNLGVNGNIAADVMAIEADLFRPNGEGAADIRLVLFNTNGDRWTSTASASVTDDGNWGHYRFSILEADLTRVQGLSSYASLTSNLQRIMFRYDPAGPDATGQPLNGSMNFDNIVAVPEPGSMFALIALAGFIWTKRRR